MPKVLGLPASRVQNIEEPAAAPACPGRGRALRRGAEPRVCWARAAGRGAPTVIAVSPVRPPSRMPAALSRHTVSGAQPRRLPMTMPMPSRVKA
jgi:hypothetical protein